MASILDSPEGYILRYHRHLTGVVAWAYARGCMDDGRSSYELLADLVPKEPAHPVLDLCCGDGFLLQLLLERGIPAQQLIGVDMSPDELIMAGKRNGVDRVTLLHERAQELSLGNATVGYVLSHWAFPFMNDIERVVAQIARVLIPGGVFSAVVKGDPRPGDACEVFFALFDEAYRANPAKIPPLGDRRVFDENGLAGLFHQGSGFAAVEVTDLDFHLDGTVLEVWSSLATVYEAYVITPKKRAALRDRFASEVAPFIRADGTVPCTMGLRQIICRRAH